MRQRFVAMFIASTFFLGLTACSGSNSSEPAGDSSQGEVNSTLGAINGPIAGTGSIGRSSFTPEAGPGPPTGPGSDIEQGPQGVPEGPLSSKPPIIMGPPPDFGVGPDVSVPEATNLEAELQNAASGEQIMDSWVCSGPAGNIDYGFVRGQLRYINSEGVTNYGTYSISSADSVSVVLDTGKRHILTDIKFLPTNAASSNRYFTAYHANYGSVSCVLT